MRLRLRRRSQQQLCAWARTAVQLALSMRTFRRARAAARPPPRFQRQPAARLWSTSSAHQHAVASLLIEARLLASLCRRHVMLCCVLCCAPPCPAARSTSAGASQLPTAADVLSRLVSIGGVALALQLRLTTPLLQSFPAPNYYVSCHVSASLTHARP